MGLNQSKKRAMVLVLILMIITSLSIFIIGAMKVLTATDTEFSFNRNSTANPSNKISGKFICYKKYDETTNTYKLYQQRVEYNTDGSIKSLQSESERTNKICEFEVPNGIKTFEITAIGGGGAGGTSERTYEYEIIDSSDCIKKNISSILAFLKAELRCTNTFSQKSCDFTYEYGSGVDFQNTVKHGVYGRIQVPKGQTCSYSCNRYSSYGSCTNYAPSCYYSYGYKYECGNGGTAQPITGENCKLVYKVGTETKETVLSESIYNLPQEEIEQDKLSVIVENGNLVSCEQHSPKYKLKIGSPGAVGEVIAVNTNNLIYGSEDGSNKISIKADDIGDGGTVDDENGGKTTLKYWYKNSKGYVEAKVSANGGKKGSTTDRTIDSPDQATNIESKEGLLPSSFELPSAFNFGGLYAGYYNSETPKRATYFGASGASGYIDDISTSLLISECTRTKINGTWDPNSKNCSAETQNRKVNGTNGAPGAVVISW